MANKSWEYMVTFQRPDDYELTPARRRTCMRETKSTTALRAATKVRKEVAEDWETEVKFIEILDAVRKPFAAYPDGAISDEDEA